jgi:hypothetical protein
MKAIFWIQKLILRIFILTIELCKEAVSKSYFSHSVLLLLIQRVSQAKPFSPSQTSFVPVTASIT